MCRAISWRLCISLEVNVFSLAYWLFFDLGKCPFLLFAYLKLDYLCFSRWFCFFCFFFFDVNHFESLSWICYNVASVLCSGFLARRHLGSSPPGDWTRVPYVGQRILRHWTPREALPLLFRKGLFHVTIMPISSVVFLKNSVSAVSGSWKRYKVSPVLFPHSASLPL